LWHAAALPRVAASERPTVATRNPARRRDRNCTLLRPLYGRQRGGRAVGHHELPPWMVWSTARQRVPPSPRGQRGSKSRSLAGPLAGSSLGVGIRAGPPAPHIREM